MTLGQKLKKLRIDKGVTQKDLADQLHVTFQTVSKWEGDTNEPDIATLKELAKFYGCSFNYLLSDEDIKEETVVVPAPTEVITKTVIIHHNEAHVCARCGKDIPEDELVSEDIYKKKRHGRTTKTVNIGQTYYHESCFEEVKKERKKAAKKKKAKKVARSKKICFGWGIAVGVIGFIIALIVFLSNQQYVHPGLGVLFSILISYCLFSMIYCILSGSYIGSVFLWCAQLSVKFPGIIFTWDLGGLTFLIVMKIIFAISGFLIGLLALAFAIVFSASLSSFSFPFVLIHNIHTNYENAF